jgi:hypothetical protein
MTIKTLSLALGGLLCFNLASSQEVTVLIDFGNDDSFRGATVPNPDPNGNFWNSVRPGLFFSDLNDTTNTATGIAYGPGAHPTDSYNGPAGDVTINTPADSDYDPVALGNIGVDEAVYDYHVGILGQDSAYFQIEGLDPNVAYTLKFYGAHKYISEPNGLTTYRVYSDAERQTLIASVDLGVGSIGDAHNRDMLAVVENISPAPDVGIFFIEFGGADGTSEGYINAMEISYVAPVQEDMWADFVLLPTGEVNTGAFLGWLQTNDSDYVWSFTLAAWIYLPEGNVSPSGAWGYINSTEIPQGGSGQDDMWAGFVRLPTGEVNTGAFLGWIQTNDSDYVWSFTLADWIYLPEGNVTSSGAWVFFLR